VKSGKNAWKWQRIADGNALPASPASLSKPHLPKKCDFLGKELTFDALDLGRLGKVVALW
jgi:hypothetical protein